ncbi:glycine zipper family protein [Domibacillus enclensis]|uniref:Uncharacterized protein n=1 Tax=Domibacillus enclensis TaxID=1017273 RepID=A0A1N6WEJ0_9BACI|nr:hypothetical protein [Domibacillus enclensis]OXS77915.1 hypothetical protein B1B05_09925 [Domibacillus enclensis]SIQ88390.1 hypothetical protein SAMN05443094_104140 [Domibacillus enclensis]
MFFKKSSDEKSAKEIEKSEKRYQKEKKKRERADRRDEKLSKLETKLNSLQEKQEQNQMENLNIIGVKIQHISGYPKIKAGKDVRILPGNETGKLRIDSILFRVKGVDWGEKTKRSGGKAAVGTIVGTVLAPGVGTVAGAAIGGRRRDDSILTMQIEDDLNITYTAYFRCNNEEYQQILKMFSNSI